jgi:hypothetical protein
MILACIGIVTVLIAAFALMGHFESLLDGVEAATP